MLNQRKARGSRHPGEGGVTQGRLSGWLMPGLSPERQDGSVKRSVNEEHGEGRFRQKEQQVQEQPRGGQGVLFREMKVVRCAGDYSSENKGERGRQGLYLEGTRGTWRSAWPLSLRTCHAVKSPNHKMLGKKGSDAAARWGVPSSALSTPGALQGWGRAPRTASFHPCQPGLPLQPEQHDHCTVLLEMKGSVARNKTPQTMRQIPSLYFPFMTGRLRHREAGVS